MKKTGKRLLAAMLLFCTILIGAAGYEVMAADEAQSTESTSGTVNSADDLPGKRIGVQLGTTGDIYVSDYESDGSGTVVERYNKGADAIQALKQGKIDCVVIDEQPAIKFVEQNTGIRILDEEFTIEEYAFVIAKDNTELLDKVNSVLEKLEADGTIANIQKNYIGTEDEIGKFPYESKDVSHENGTLTVGTNAEFPPYESYEDGQIVGIDMDIMRAVSDELGMELEIEDIAFDSIIPEIVSGKADMALAGMTVTEDRKASVDFSDTYATASQMIIVKEDSKIAGPDDLKGVTVGVQLGTTGDIYVSDLEADGTTVERYNKGFEAVQALSQGKIDAVVIDGEPAKTFVSETEGLKILDEAFTVEEYAIAVKKGNSELLDKINTALESLKDNGTLDEIVAKYIKAE